MTHKFYKKFDLFFFIAIVTMLLMLVWSAQAQQTGEQKDREDFQLVSGTLVLEKSVIAGGGSSMENQTAGVTATVGEAAAGKKSNGGNFTLFSGFWTPGVTLPTAANVTVGGRVKTSDGRGIKNVLVTIVFPTGERRTAVSGALGYYRFADIRVGAGCFFSVSAKRFSFSQSSQFRQIAEETEDVDFIADAPPSSTSEAFAPS